MAEITLAKEAELRRLLDASTESPRPWQWGDSQWGEGILDADGAIVAGNSGRSCSEWIDEDRELAIAAVNALSDLLSTLTAERQARQEAERGRDAAVAALEAAMRHGTLYTRESKAAHESWVKKALAVLLKGPTP